MLVTISKIPSLFTCFFLYDIFFGMFMFYFVLHVVKTWLDVVFVKTCVYTCTSSEQQIDVCTSLFICTHYMHMYRLVLMIISFIHVLPIFMVYFMYMQFLFKSNKYTCIPVSLLPSCKLYHRLFLCLGYVCILLGLDKSYIYLEVYFFYKK